MRLIDADELMESIRKALGIKSMTKSLLLPAERTIIDQIDSAPTIGGWISVKDRPPETNDEVLTTYLYDDEPNKRYVETASYFDYGEGKGHWHSVSDEFIIGRVRKTIIAWMPMPKPYKPSKEDNDEAD